MNGIKKAALVLSGLEYQAVDQLLSRLDAESARAVRREMMSFRSVSVQESDRLRNEFLQAAGRKHPKRTAVREHQFADTVTYAPPKSNKNAVRYGAEAFIPPSRPFDFLRHTETDGIVRELAGEHPQTVAVVLAHLPASQAGKVLGCLPARLKEEVTERLSEYETTDELILHEIESSLRSRLENQRPKNAVVQKILEQSRNFSSNSTTELPGTRFTFDDLERLSNAELSTLFHSVDAVTAMLALIGATPPLIERVTKRFSPTEEDQMRQTLKRLGTIDEEDIDRARNAVLHKAEHLLSEK